MNKPLALLVGTFLFLAACGREGDAPAARQTPPATRSATIQVEGETDTVTVQSYESPPDAPLAFSTSLPAGMRPEAVAETGSAVKFISEADPRAWVHVFIHPPEQPEDQAREDVRAVAESYGVPGVGEVEPSERYPWAIAEFRFRSRGTTAPTLAGSVALGRHAGRFFHIIVQYPVEFGDGFVPRAQRILDEWRWRDTGEPLTAR